MGRPLPIALMMTSKSILGVNMLKIADFKPHVLKACLQEVYALYNEKKILPLAGGTYQVSDIKIAHEALSSGKTMGKIAITWN